MKLRRDEETKEIWARMGARCLLRHKKAFFFLALHRVKTGTEYKHGMKLMCWKTLCVLFLFAGVEERRCCSSSEE
jgi:hypothetical protein